MGCASTQVCVHTHTHRAQTINGQQNMQTREHMLVVALWVFHLQGNTLMQTLREWTMIWQYLGWL